MKKTHHNHHCHHHNHHHYHHHHYHRLFWPLPKVQNQFRKKFSYKVLYNCYSKKDYVVIWTKYGKHQLSWPMRILGPIQTWRGCVIYLFFPPCPFLSTPPPPPPPMTNERPGSGHVIWGQMGGLKKTAPDGADKQTNKHGDSKTKWWKVSAFSGPNSNIQTLT